MLHSAEQGWQVYCDTCMRKIGFGDTIHGAYGNAKEAGAQLEVRGGVTVSICGVCTMRQLHAQRILERRHARAKSDGKHASKEEKEGGD